MSYINVSATAGGPFLTIECPDGTEDANADDLQKIAGGALANDLFLQSGAVVPYQFTQTNFTLATPWIGPPNAFIGSTWTDSIVTIDIPNTKADDDLRIEVWGTWQLNTTSASSTIGEMRMHVTEDVGGLAAAFPVTGISTINEQAGLVGQSVNQPYALHARHRVTNPGTARVTLQLRSEDLTGGAGTATLILMFSARLDVDHHKRS